MIKQFSAALTLCAVVILPTLTHAAGVTLPPASEAIGITEATYQQLQEAHCYFEEEPNSVKTTLGRNCDPLVAKLEHNIVMRVEAHGEQYWINTGDGLPIVNRYLADGFYKAGKKHFLVTDGFRVRLQKGSAYQTVLSGVQSGDIRMTGISEEDFGTFYGIGCEEPGTEHICDEQVQRREELTEQLAGRIVMRAETDGSLWYLDVESQEFVELSEEMDGQSFFSFVKSESTPVSKSVMKEVVPNVI